MNRIVYIVLCLPLLLAGCDSNVVSSAHRNLPSDGWALTDTVCLSLQVDDTTQAYDFALLLRYTDQYTYQNLWLFVQTCDSLSPIQSDTIMAHLADDRGKWLGTRVGRYYTGYVIAERNILFPATGIYSFAIVQGMRDSVITGIADVGLELRKHDNGQE